MKTKVFLFAILCFSWGSGFLPLKLALEGLPPFLLAALRFLLAGSILFLVVKTKRLAWRDFLNIALASLPVITANYALVFWGAQFLPSGLTGVLSFASVSLALPLFSIMYKLERPSLQLFAGLATGLLGFVVLALGIDFSNENRALLGVTAIALAAVATSWGSMISRPLIQKCGALKVSSTQMLVGGSLLLAMSFWLEQPTLTTFSTLLEPSVGLSLLYLVVIGSVIGFTLYQHLLATWRVDLLASYNFVSPVIALLLGVLFLDERFSFNEAIALVLLLLATLVLFSRKR